MKRTDEQMVADCAVRAVRAYGAVCDTGCRTYYDVFSAAQGHEKALTALLLRLGYSPHNAFAHGKLVPLVDDPLNWSADYPHEPILDK